MSDYQLPLDRLLFALLNRPAGDPIGDAGVVLGTRWVDLGLLLLAVAFLIWKLRLRALRSVVVIAVALGWTDLLGARVLRPLFHRLRPCFALPAGQVHQLMPVANRGSLPSLHAADSFAAATALWFVCPELGIWPLVIAALIAISRVVVGVHWPSDVVLGALYGSAMGYGTVRLAERLGVRRG